MKRLWNKRIIISGIVAIAILIIALVTTSYVNKIKAREELERIIEANNKANQEANLKEKDTVKELEEEEIVEEEFVGPGDPTRMLSSGMTLSEAKSLIEVEREVSKISELSEEETQKALKELAKKLGTTLAEVNSIDVMGVVKDPKYQQPSYTEETPQEAPSNNGGGSVVHQPSGNSNNGSGSVQQPSNGGDGTGGSGAFDGIIIEGPGTSEEDPDFHLEMPGDEPTEESTEWDKNGNGISDSFEDSYLGGGVGSTVEDPDFQLEMPGD